MKFFYIFCSMGYILANMLDLLAEFKLLPLLEK